MSMTFFSVYILALSMALQSCNASTGKREVPVIRDPDESAPTTPTVEADKAGSVSMDPYATVMPLNDVLFRPNVLQAQHEDVAVHWVVYFCPSWWEPCQTLLKPFALQSDEWQGRLNDGLLHTQVRFARVDCASHKPLCNSQQVNNYPTVHHYFQGSIVSSWTANGRNDDKRLAKWIGKELTPVPAASTVVRKAADPRLAIVSILNTDMISGDRMLDLFVLLGVIAVNFWSVCKNPGLLEKRASRQVEKQASATVQVSPADRLALILPEEWRRGNSFTSSLSNSIEL